MRGWLPEAGTGGWREGMGKEKEKADMRTEG